MTNHSFIDGNKRVALVAMDMFLQMNGFELVAAEAVAAAFFLDLAASLGAPEQEQARLSQWIAVNARSL